MKSVMKKRGISPVVATVLLVLLVVIIALIIFLWFRSITQESVTKFGSDVQVVCQEVDFDVSYSSGVLSFVNNAQAPIYDFMIFYVDVDSGSTETQSLRDLGFAGLSSGATAEVDFSTPSGTSELNVVPVLLGETSSGDTQPYQCDEQLGVKVTVA